MANIILPAVPVLNEIDDSTKLLIEQAGEINRYPISDLDIGGGDVTIDLNSPGGDSTNTGNPINADTLGGYAADEYVRKDQLTDFAPTSPVELNYSVVGSVEEPVNPTQNMIWIQTETPIGRVFFGNNEPNETFIEGDVYICTGTSSSVAFNSLKIGNSYMDMVYPLSAKQYVDGAWVDKTAKSYQGGEWREVFTKTLFSNGKDYEYVTGGWYAVNDGTQLVFTIPIVSSESKKFYTNKEAVDLTYHKAVTIKVNSTSEDTSTWCLGIFDTPVNGENVEPVVKKEDAYMKAGEHILDVSALRGKYYIGAGLNRNVSAATSNIITICIGAVTME